jgi:hypothetical protein
MAGTIVADNLMDGAGNSTAMDNAIYGSAKAWVNFNGVTTATVRASYNVSSVTRTATGSYTINMTTAMSDANYAILVSCGNANGTAFHVPEVNLSVTPTTTQFGIQTVNTGFGLADENNVYVAVFR